MFALVAARIPRGEPKDDVIDVMLKHKISFELLSCPDDLGEILKYCHGGPDIPSNYKEEGFLMSGPATSINVTDSGLQNAILSNANAQHGFQNGHGLNSDQVGHEADPDREMKEEIKEEVKEEYEETPSDPVLPNSICAPPVDYEAPRDQELVDNSVSEHVVKEEVQEPPPINQEPLNTTPDPLFDHEMPGGISEEIICTPAAEHEVKEEVWESPDPVLFPGHPLSTPPIGHEEPRNIFEGVKIEPFDAPLLNPDERDIDLTMDTDDEEKSGDYSGDRVDACDAGDDFENTMPSNEANIYCNSTNSAPFSNNPLRTDDDFKGMDSQKTFIETYSMDFIEHEQEIPHPPSVIQAPADHIPDSHFGDEESQDIFEDVNSDPIDRPLFDQNEGDMVDYTMDYEEMEEDVRDMEERYFNDGEEIHKASFLAPASPINDRMLEGFCNKSEPVHTPPSAPNESDVGLMSDCDDLVEDCSDAEEQPDHEANNEEEPALKDSHELVEDSSDAEEQPDPEANKDKPPTTKDASSKQKKNHQCGVCKKSFTRPNHLAVHYRTHTGDKPFECNICRSKFAHASSVTIHMRSHTGEKPFVCDVCQKSFVSSDLLRRHHRIHTGEKSFECDVCHSKFSRRFYLQCHVRIHTGEKPFPCNKCDKRFSEPGNRNRHLRTHTGDKPYECKECHKKFSYSGSLVQHNRRFHN